MMKTGTRSALIATHLLILSLIVTPPSKASDTTQSAFDFQSLVDLVENGLEHAADRLDEDEVAKIDSAELAIELEIEVGAEAGFKLFFFELGAGVADTTTSTVTLKYDAVSAGGNYPTSNDYVVVSDAIVTAAQAAAKVPLLSDLPMTEFTVDLQFGLQVDSAGGVEIKFSDLEISGRVSAASTKTNRLSLSFSPF